MHELVTYLTKQLVYKMNNPHIARKQKKPTNVYTHRWFGLFPLYFKMLSKK